VNEVSEPVTVDYIAKELHVAWDTARALLLTLTIDRKIVGMKTMKSWVFMPKRESNSTARTEE
jgi:hypothetical protein